MTWSANSANLNPTENLNWIFKRTIRRLHPQKIYCLLFGKVGAILLKNITYFELVKSISERTGAVIKTREKEIKY